MRFNILKYTFIMMCLGVSGCNTTKQASLLTNADEALQAEQGVLGYRVGHRTINPEGHFPSVRWSMTLMRNSTDDDEEAREAINATIEPELFRTTHTESYVKRIGVHALEPDNYKIASGSLSRFLKTKTHERDFKVIDSSVTYIGDFDYETTSAGSGFSNKLKRTVLEVRCDAKGFADELRREYPGFINVKVYDYCVHEGRFRLPPANGSVRAYVQISPTSHTSNGIPTYNTTIETY